MKKYEKTAYLNYSGLYRYLKLREPDEDLGNLTCGLHETLPSFINMCLKLFIQIDCN